MTTRRIKTGDIFEIRTPQGFAYLQNVLKHEEWGNLIRILEPIFEVRPAAFEHIAAQPERFMTFFPLAAAQARRIVQFVGTATLPAHCRKFPLFKTPGNIDKGRVLDWWLWDGQTSWKIGNLSEEHRYLPVQMVMNDTRLIERIADNWRSGEDLFDTSSSSE